MTRSTTTLANGLQSVIEPARVVADPSILANYAVHNLQPGAAARPTSAEEAAEVVRFAAAEKLAVVPCGARSKLALSAAPRRYDIALDLSALRQFAHYDPADLTLSVDAGMPLATLNAKLAEHEQFLPLLAPYYSVATVGGAIASGLDSPLRQFYGTARDFLLGAEFIDGTGALVKSGGRVVKNVAGYDLHKLLIGSLGTLGVITRLNFRTFPFPQSTRGFLASFASHEAALAFRRKVAASPIPSLTLDLLNPTAAGIFATRTPQLPEVSVFAGENGHGVDYALPLPGNWFRSQEWQVGAAFGGTPDVIERCSRDLTRFAEESSTTSISILDDRTRPSVWGRLREALPLFRDASPHAVIVRLNVLPSFHLETITVLEAVSHSAGSSIAIVARASGTLYAAILPKSLDDTSLENIVLLIREILTINRRRYADVAILWAPPIVRRLPAAAPPPESSILPRLLKSAFDPHDIFAPARVV